MVQLHTAHQVRPLSSSAGKVSEVFLIETEGTHDLPYFLRWLRLARVHRGILLLVNISDYDYEAWQVIREIRDIGIDILPVDFIQPSPKPARPGPQNSYALATTDLILSFTHSYPSGRKTLYIGSHSRHDYRGLRYDYRFRSALRRLGVDTIACSDDDRPLIEGGDCLMVGHHFFIGPRTQAQFGVDAGTVIRQYYGLQDDLHIHTIGVSDPSSSAGLYHLDLYFAYAGINSEGIHRFFIGYIDDTSIGDPTFEDMRSQLEIFNRDIVPKLVECFAGHYELTAVPIICCDMYRVSPLNGIIDYINGVPTYYFPWPEFINATHHPLYDTQVRIMASVQKAYDIIAIQMGGEENVIKFPIPIGYTAGSGQSLHCTMGIIGREID